MGRSPCCEKIGLKRGPWTSDEDLKLTQYIQMHGPGNWRALPNNAGLERCGKSCRLRWTNYLRPDIKRGRFSFEEEETIIQLHSVLGNKWSAIAAHLPGRTDNEIKNYWNTHIRKRLLRMGIDPVTHSPRLDLLDMSSILNSTQLNLSSVIQLQTLLNPDALRLAMSLVSSQTENDQILLNSQVQGEGQFVQPNQFENNINQHIPSNFITSSFENNNNSQSHESLQSGHIGHFDHVGSTTSSCQIFQDTSKQIDLGTDNIQCFSNNENNCDQKQMRTELSEENGRDFSFDSMLSTPDMSSATAQLKSVSALVNGSTEDESDRFCSSLLRFEGLGFEEFM